MYYLEKVSAKKATSERFGPITSDSFVLGRNPNANVILKNLAVSRRHCILTMKADSIHIQDLGSYNGTFINETKLEPNSERILIVNDLIGVGSEVSDTANGCIYRLLKIDENVNTEKVTTIENTTTNTKRLANWENSYESSSKKCKITADDQNQTTNVKIALPSTSMSNQNKIETNEIKIELPLTSMSNQNKIETNVIKIELEDDNSVDMFSEFIPIMDDNQIKKENITVLSLLDSDEEDNPYTDNNYIQPNNDLAADNYVIISSDEEENNTWLQKLSQRSTHSPPPQIDNWHPSDEEQNNQWWPMLSQNILDEFEKEDQHDNNIIDSNIKALNEPDKSSNKIDNSYKLKEFREKENQEANNIIDSNQASDEPDNSSIKIDRSYKLKEFREKENQEANNIIDSNQASDEPDNSSNKIDKSSKLKECREKEEKKTNNIDSNIKGSNEPDKSDNSHNLLECSVKIKFMDQIDEDKGTFNSIVHNLKKIRPGKYVKPPIIEAPLMLKPVKEPKHTVIKPPTEKIEKKDKKHLRQMSDKKNIIDYTRNKSKSPINVNKKKDLNCELRKKRLKELAVTKSNKNKKSPKKDNKEKIKPKVKCTTTNRSDLFTADILKTVDRPSTSTSKSNGKLPTLKTVDRPSTCTSKSNEKLPTLKSVDKTSTCTSKSNEKLPTLNPVDRTSTCTSKSNEKLPTLNPVDRTSTCTSKSNENIPILKIKNKEIIRNNDVKSNNKLPAFKNKEIIRKTDVRSNNHLPATKNNDIIQDNMNENNFLSTNHCIDPIIQPSINKNRSTKKVSFDLTPNIRLFTKNDWENSPSYLMFRDRRPLLKFSFADYFYKEDIIYEIVNWETKSLLTPNTPMNLMSDVKQNNIVYDNYQQYYHTFKNLIMLELWSLIQHEYNINDSLKRVYQVDIKSFYVHSEPMRKDRKTINLDCQLLLTKEDDQNMIHPKVGDVIIIKLATENANGILESKSRFGYVMHIRKQSINQSRDELPLQLIASVKNPQVLVQLIILTMWDSNTLVTDNCVQIRRLGRITGIMKEIIALQKLPQSSLMPLILNPNRLNNINNYYGAENINNNYLNFDQAEIINRVSDSCLSTHPTINLIHGPPGTGKSYLIVNLVIHLLYGNDRYANSIENRNNLPRILICAPTNSAIDDIAIKLLNIRKNQSIKFRMVRVGQKNKMHPHIQCISSQSLNELNAKINMFRESERFKAANKNRNGKMDNIREDVKCKNNSAMDEELIIREADIICTTLGSSNSTHLENLANNRSFRFTTCIIDEATQCSEPASLSPLLLGIDSLVLVGDINQLPATIQCQEAKKYGLGQSLFERIQKCFPINHNCPSIRRLSVQYRMHPEIMEFPNKYFYSNRIVNSPVVYEYKFPLIPYHLFLHEFEQCDTMNNSREAEFILNMIKTILSEVNFKVTIGIITPYQNQRATIMKVLQVIDRKEDIIVNTVDGFQGQEKDIIILSCVRTEGLGFLADDQRINVALTRAKYSFYIVGNFQTLKMHPTWRALKDDAEHRKKVFYTRNELISQDVFSKVLKNKNFV